MDAIFLADFRRTVADAAGRLLIYSDTDAARPLAPGKWSRKEIIGHLIDSAANNHARFVRAQLHDDLVFEGYDQARWVEVQRYRERPWTDLVGLWQAYNVHIASVMESADRRRRASAGASQPRSHRHGGRQRSRTGDARLLHARLRRASEASSAAGADRDGRGFKSSWIVIVLSIRELRASDIATAGPLFVDAYPHRAHEVRCWYPPDPREQPQRWDVFLRLHQCSSATALSKVRRCNALRRHRRTRPSRRRRRTRRHGDRPR
jgi:hypothetical protein